MYTSRPPIRVLIAGLLALSFAAAAAPAARPEVRPDLASALRNYQHTKWTPENGAPPLVLNMAQTPDGWLWLGTADGLYRFDGVSFERRELPRGSSPVRRRIWGLYAHDNGDLYINYFPEGLTVLHRDGRIDEVPMPADEQRIGFTNVCVDADGSVWAIGSLIYHLSGGRWTAVDRSPEWGPGGSRSMLLDQDGRLWASNEAGAWRLDRTRGRFDKVSAQGGKLAQAPDGGVWLFADKGAASRLAPSASGKPRPRFANTVESRAPALFDADGNLWTLNCPEPVCLVPGPGARTAFQAGTAAPNTSGQVFEDREGNIWIAAATGLERFRPKRLLDAGLAPGTGRYSLAADPDGHAWAADQETGTLWRLQPGRAAVQEAQRQASVVSTARDGALLIGGKRGIERRARGASGTIPLPPGPDGKPFDHRMLGILDDGEVLWTATMETGLIGWRDGKWLPRGAFDLPQKIYLSGAGKPGQLWLATGDGRLVSWTKGKQTGYDASPVGIVTGIFPGAELAVGGELGFAVLKDGQLQRLRAASPDALRGISGLAVSADGDRWLNGTAGLVHVRAADWRRAMEQPDEPLRYELFDALDGYPGQAELAIRLPSALMADGRHVWAVASGGVVAIDTRELRRNTLPPMPVILGVATDKAAFGGGAAQRLPPGSSAFRVQFTAPALRKPERVRFEYRLDGIDERWQDAGPRRTTSYANVGPGDYLFHVRAVNEDGVASLGDASMRLVVEPTLVQSTPFRVACGLALIALLTALYRYRVRYLTRRHGERLRVKTAERERIARTLHDTFLQNVQAMTMRLDAVASSLPEGDRTRGQLETIRGHASSAIGEGRKQLEELRSSDAHALEDVLADAAARLREAHPGTAFALDVEGKRRELSAAAAEEACEIAREALRNAFAHARAGRISVRLDYGRRALTVSVSDDGQGLDPEVARSGYRSGHWGLIGMRERAQRIGARLAVDSTPGSGTTVALTVPAGRAYVR
jgi:signal transduction histidine kinase/ligand-binding sensor domain-containing protein